jgi:hypothetical protein
LLQTILSRNLLLSLLQIAVFPHYFTNAAPFVALSAMSDANTIDLNKNKGMRALMIISNQVIATQSFMRLFAYLLLFVGSETS